MKLALALFAISSAAIAQTGTTPATPAKPVVHHAASSASATPASAIPKVVGLPKTLYTMKYIDIRIGTGPLAETHKFYTVTYTGWLTNGKKFDSSFDHEGTFTFPDGARPARVITGWDTGFEGMHVGGKRRLFVPYQLAYGVLGNPPVIPAKSALIFDVELISMSDKPPAPKTPPTPPGDVKKPAGGAPGAPMTPPAATTPPPAGAPANAPAAPPAATPPPPPAAPSAPPAPAKPPTPPAK